MPHDMRNQVLKVGDRVLVPCVVTNISESIDYCNVTVVTARSMPPYDAGTTVTMNTKQVAKVDHLTMREDGAEDFELFPDAG